jgi:uncharacterized protein (TIGR03083 family)
VIDRTDPIESVAADLAAVRADGTRLLELAVADWDRPAPTCPGWSVGDVAVHTAGAHRWAERILAQGERVHRRDVPTAPDTAAAAPAWCRDGLALLLARLEATDPDASTWTFSPTGEQRAAWWYRRMAQETAMHRADVEVAVEGTTAGFDAALAVAGIDEYLGELLPRLAGGPTSGTLHLHATDADGEWFVDLADRSAPLRREHRKADVALRGGASDLLLWLWNRRPAEGHLEVLGNEAVIAGWAALTV